MIPDDEGPTPQDPITAFSSRLARYSETLSVRERMALNVILVSAMDPLERMFWRDASSLLTPEEQRLLDAARGEN